MKYSVTRFLQFTEVIEAESEEEAIRIAEFMDLDDMDQYETPAIAIEVEE